MEAAREVESGQGKWNDLCVQLAVARDRRTLIEQQIAVLSRELDDAKQTIIGLEMQIKAKG